MEKTNPLISIIVPVYNVKEYVVRCLESIAAQTFTHYECIVVDDGSTDGSGDLCDNFAATHDRFRVIHQPNKGLSMARNSGLKVAQGQYIGFVDSDDWIHPDMYRVMLEQLQACRADLIACHFHCCSNFDKNFPDNPPVACQTVNREQLFNLWMGGYIQHPANFEPVWNKLYSREVVAGIEFVPGLTSQDQEFNFRVYLRVGRVAILNQAFYYYFQRTDSITGTAYHGGQEKHLSYLLTEFKIQMERINYFDLMTEKEQGYVLGFLMRKSIKHQQTAKRLDKAELLAEFKRGAKVVEPMLLANTTVPLSKKIALYASAHSPLIFNFLSWVYNLVRR